MVVVVVVVVVVVIGVVMGLVISGGFDPKRLVRSEHTA